MSLITRCPACATMFKVVPDQLRVSEGWVRCGQCSEVFDANAHLQDPDAAARPAPPPIPTPEPTPEAPPAPHFSHVDIETGDPEPQTAVVEPEPEHESLPDPFLAVNPHALYIDPLDDSAVGSEPVEPILPAEPPAQPDPPAALAEEDETPELQEEAADDIEGEELHHAFLQPRMAAPKPAQHRAIRIALVALTAVLGLGLLLQIAVHERNRIVAFQPSAKAVLEPLCELLGCRMSPLQQIESVVIDSSSFAKVRGDVYRLGFTLKNVAQIPLATPALELTLTDLQDQAVVRKVFTVADFAEKQMVLEPAAELPVSLPVAVKLGGNGERISGYRLLSFYP